MRDTAANGEAAPEFRVRLSLEPVNSHTPAEAVELPRLSPPLSGAVRRVRQSDHCRYPVRGDEFVPTPLTESEFYDFVRRQVDVISFGGEVFTTVDTRHGCNSLW